MSDLTSDYSTPAPSTGKRKSELPTFAGATVSQLWSLADVPVEWLVHDLFAADQPTVIGARKKSLKTTLLTDLVVALATGTDWLQKFKVPQIRRTLFITGESNDRAAIRRVKRAVTARGLSKHDLADNLRVEAMSIPKLANAADRAGLAKDVEDNGFDVVVLDPLYRAMGGTTNAGNLFEMGELLGWFLETCRPASIIIAHHLKASAKFDLYPDLDDLSQAGVAEFAGNHLLLGRLSEYKGDGFHNLAFAYGGRDEQCGRHRLLFDERGWNASLRDLDGYLQSERNAKQQRVETEKFNAMSKKILQALQDAPEQTLSESKLAAHSGTRTDRAVFRDTLREMHEKNRITRIDNYKAGTKTCTGWRLGGGDDTCADQVCERAYGSDDDTLL